jgi:hypothetical protein
MARPFWLMAPMLNVVAREKAMGRGGVRVAGSAVFDVNSTCCNKVAATRLTVQITNVGKFAGASRLYRPRHRAMLPVMKAVITAGGGQHWEDCGWIEQGSNDQDQPSTYVLVRGEITWSTIWSSFPCPSSPTAHARQEAAGAIGQGQWPEGLLQSLGKPIRARLAGVPSPSGAAGTALVSFPVCS